MKKIIFLCLVLITAIANIFETHEAEARQKVRQYIRYKFSDVRNPATSTAEILIRYISKMKFIHPKNICYKSDGKKAKIIQYYYELKLER